MNTHAVIKIDDQDGNIVLQCGGTYEPGDDSLVERLSLAAVAAIDAEMQKMQGDFADPIVTGDRRAIDKSVFAESKTSAFPWWRT